METAPSGTLLLMPDAPPAIRHAARILLLDEAGRLLLFGNNEWRQDRTLWMTPGGGVDAGETHEEAATRELWEETGQRDIAIGPCVWTRSFTFRWQDQHWDQRERFFIARCEQFEPSAANRLAYEESILSLHRWWAADEILASKDYFVPRALAGLLPHLVAGDFPPEPIYCGT